MNKIPESELILNPDNSVYHLNLLPHEVAETIINVGDPDRVGMVSKFFEKIEVKKQTMQPQRTQRGYAATEAVFTAETQSAQRSEQFLIKKFFSASSAPPR